MAPKSLAGSAASSWMLRDRGERMLRAEPEVTSTVDIFVKDLGIVLADGRDAKAVFRSPQWRTRCSCQCPAVALVPSMIARWLGHSMR